MREPVDDLVAQPCVRSGLCCKKGPCPYGIWDAQKRQCAYLEVEEQTPAFTRYRCGRYEFIRAQPGADVVPAFGAGCCMSLFNANRERILRHYRSAEASEPLSGLKKRIANAD